jgi:glycosyltransferase involved in cell wall biosynthesis
MPTVNAIVPTYNRPEDLRRAIASVLGQTFVDVGVIVVDDASSDHTPAVVAGIGDKRVTYFRHERNKGDAAARNLGLMNADCKYVAFLDDDDEWLPQKLATQVTMLDESPVQVAGVHTNRWDVDEAGRETLRTLPVGQVLLRGNYITTSSVMLRRTCFADIGLFDETLPYNSDYDMWLRISTKYRFRPIDAPLIKYRVYGERLSTNSLNMIRGLELLLKKHASLFAQDRKIYSDRYCTLGVLYCNSGDLQKGQQAYLKAIGLYPFAARYYAYLGLSLLRLTHVGGMRRGGHERAGRCGTREASARPRRATP